MGVLGSPFLAVVAPNPSYRPRSPIPATTACYISRRGVQVTKDVAMIVIAKPVVRAGGYA